MRNFILSLGLLSLIALILCGCPEREYDYYYEVLIENTTNDTLLFMDGTDNLPSKIPFHKFIILPKEIANGEKSRYFSFAFNGSEEPVPFFFSQFSHPLDTVLVFRRDTLKARWVYPAYSGPSSEHSFFNYNSWKSWIAYEKHGKIMFTIYPSDLILNKK